MAFKNDKGRLNDMVVNVDPKSGGASPDGKLPPPPAGNFNNAKAWGAPMNGVSQGWSNYKKHLSTSFAKLSRFQQEALINRLCQIVTIGVTLLALLIFYHMMPMAVRVLIVPIAVVAAWWGANNVVTPVMIARVEPILKPREESPTTWQSPSDDQ